MAEKMLEIREFTGPGYLPVIDFSTWRVAILNYIDEILRNRNKNGTTMRPMRSLY